MSYLQGDDGFKGRMRVVCIADLQSQAPLIRPSLIPKGDILLVAGDLGGWGDIDEIIKFDEWIGELPHKHKIIVAGNHDICLENIDGHYVFRNCIYLENELVEIEGLRIYGSPLSDMNTLYYRTRFNAFSHPLYVTKSCEDIPDNLDFLITHGPAVGLLDKTVGGLSVGSKELRKAVLTKKPKYHVFGHIHEAYGKLEYDSTTFINAALCSERNQLFSINDHLYHDPIVIDL